MENIARYLPYLRGYDFTGKIPVIIDFYATWCGPCRGMAPALKQLASQYAGRVKVLKVDVDKNEALAAAAGIRSVPTLFFISLNGDITRSSGALSLSQLQQGAEALLR